MNNYKKILSLCLTLVFNQAEVLPAGGLQLGLIEGIEQDNLVRAILAGDGIDDVPVFWNTNVEAPLTAEVGALGPGIVTSIANRIKENILTALLSTAEIGQAVVDEIERSHADGAENLIIAELPPAITAHTARLVFISEEELASLGFAFQDLLTQGATVEAILARITAIENQFDESNEYNPIAIDPRIYGLDILVEQPVQVIPAPPKILTPSQFRSMREYVRRRLKNLRTRNITFETPLACTPYPDRSDETACMICTSQDCPLYKNICTTCSDPSIALCMKCITQTTVQNVIGTISLVATGDTGPVHIDFSLKLPKCWFCNTPYYDASNFAALEKALPIRKRRALVLQALQEELVRLGDLLPSLLSRLIASSIPLKNIKTHRPSGDLVSAKWLALQIYEKTAAMKENIREHFSNEDVWIR